MENYAGFWIRVGAYIIDSIVIGIAQWILFTIFGASMFGVNSLDPATADAAATTGASIAIIATSVIYFLYFAIMESSAKQATLGKMALGLVVVDANGNRISFLRALGRSVSKIISYLILYIGVIMVGFTERKQGLHDMICSTLVLKAAPGETGVDTSVFE